MIILNRIIYFYYIGNLRVKPRYLHDQDDIYLDLFDVYISMDYHKIVLTLSLLILSNWMAPAFFIFTLLFYPLLNFMTRFRIIGL